MDLITKESMVAGWVKISLLAHGIDVDSSVFDFVHGTSSIATRKNVYNTPVWLDGELSIPQELRVMGLVVGLNSYGRSPWRLRWSQEDAFLVLDHVTGMQYRPEIIPDLGAFAKDETARTVANLYGGAALAFFSPRSCYFFSEDHQCHFCSLAGTATHADSYKAVLSEQDVRGTVRLALHTDPGRIEQIMIVGGNDRDLDRGFRHHVALAAAAAREVERVGLSQSISIHIATMPPHDLSLLQSLRDFSNIHVMFNLEVWDDKTFALLCPGKARDYGRKGILQALERLRDTIGAYRAHSLLVTGLEPPEIAATGMEALSSIGISPIINIYHSDRYSRLGTGVRPRFSHLSNIACSLQRLYDKFPIKPYWRNCGRNAIDAEAQKGLFRYPIPDFLRDDA